MNDLEHTAYHMLDQFITRKKMNDIVGHKAIVSALRMLADDIEKDPLAYFGQDAGIPKLSKHSERRIC